MSTVDASSMPAAVAVQPPRQVQLPGAAGAEHLAAQRPRREPIVDAASEAAKTAAKAAEQVQIEKYSRPARESYAAAAEQIQGFLSASGRNLNVYVDDVTGYYVARIVNPETGELVRQLPSDEMLRIARNIDAMRGLLVNQIV